MGRKKSNPKKARRARTKARKEAIPTKQPKAQMFSEQEVRNLLRIQADHTRSATIRATLDMYDKKLGIGKWNVDILSGLAPSGSQFVGLRRVYRKKRGRPINHSKRIIWIYGARLRQADEAFWSWSKLARQLDPEGYKQDARLATYRMCQGIKSALKRMPKKKS